MTDLLMSGHDRTYQPPRSMRRAASSVEEPTDLQRRIAAGRCTATDLIELSPDIPWAEQTLTSLIASIDTEAADALGCTDCEDTGFYGVLDNDNDDLLTGLVRRVGDGEYETLAASGMWEPWQDNADTEVLTYDLAADLASAITSGASGLLRKFCEPIAFLPPTKTLTASLLADLASSADSEVFAVVDDDDVGAVMTVARQQGDKWQQYADGEWIDWELLDGELLAIPLGDEEFEAITAATGLVAYVSPNPKAEKLRRYWSNGRGGAKIRWGTPGDWKRCYRHLRKYLGVRAKGYCQNMHKRNTGVYTGSRLNPGRGLRSDASLEETLIAAIESGQWSGESERNSEMTLADGVYTEVDDSDSGLLRTLVAGGFPVAPPDEWYTDPGFSGPTPMQVDDDGRVKGHIATWDVTHIGMAGSVHAPKSKSGYAYFQTGSLKTATGKLVNVGQLTLSGGHAPIHASAKDAVKHYDDTDSAVADVTVGEDAYGIWAAGSLRPDITPAQVRAFRASPLSGDWRPIGGNLELVAACAVNVPGFPIAQALAAGGAILALVAAGARPLAERRVALTADAIVLERLDALEARFAAEPEPVAVVEETASVVVAEDPVPAAEVTTPTAEVAVDEVIAAPEPEVVPASAAVAEAPVAEVNTAEALAAATEEHPEEVQPEVADKLDPEQIAQARADAKAIRRDWLRREVHGDGVTAALPPAFLKNAAKNSDKKIPETERKGGGYPIKDAASLRNAIKAVGRAAEGDRAKTIAHIKAAAKKLGLEKLLPKTPGW